MNQFIPIVFFLLVINFSGGHAIAKSPSQSAAPQSNEVQDTSLTIKKPRPTKRSIPDEYFIPGITTFLGGLIALAGFTNPWILIIAGAVLLLTALLLLFLTEKPKVNRKAPLGFMLLGIILAAIFITAIIAAVVVLLIIALILLLAGIFGTAAVLPWIGLGFSTLGLAWLLYHVFKKKKKIEPKSDPAFRSS